MKILALDCSTDACSVALLSDNGLPGPEINQLFELAPRQHTQRILPLVSQLLEQQQTTVGQLDAIAFGRGPGSFTGLRICLGAVQGLAFGADLPVVPVSSLAAQAHQWCINTGAAGNNDCRIISTLDARMDEIYWGEFQSTEYGLTLIDSERLTSPEQLTVTEQALNNETPTLILGAGLNYAARIPAIELFRQFADIVPTAEAVASLAYIDFKRGICCAADQALPIYLRDQVAWQKQPPAKQ